jgi:hypothetical protein
MTRNRDLKRRVRDRQGQTGESYMTALRHVQSQRGDLPAVALPPSEPISVIELIDITELGPALGIQCQIRLNPKLADRIDVASALRQLCAVLRATLSDPTLDAMRAVVLHGQRPLALPAQPLQDSLRYVQRLRAGVGGVSGGGHMLAFSVTGRHGDGELLVFMLWTSPRAHPTAPLTLIVSSVGLFDEGPPSWLRTLGRLP